MSTVLVPLEDGDLEVEFEFTSFGSPDSYFEPGDPPELEVHEISWAVGIRIPECLWEVQVPAHRYAFSWEKTMGLAYYCETWILATEHPEDYYPEPDPDEWYDTRHEREADEIYWAEHGWDD